MLKSSLLFLYLVFFTRLYAQEENFARSIKVSAADSLLPVKESVKSQLNKEMISNGKNSTARLVLIGADKESGTTTSRWLAARQKQDLYHVNLSGLVSKYIGETEKNLENLFSRAEDKNWILFFDEADALFGKRGSADSVATNDTNAGLAYFLKRIRDYKGIILIACIGNDCLTTLARQKFTAIRVSP